MAKKKEDFTYKIESCNIFAEKPNTDWCKAFVRISWGDRPPGVDIRNIKANSDLDKIVLGKGITMTDEDADKLTEMLVDNGYGNTDTIKSSIEKRVNMFSKSA